jgi:hypothetical protein
MGPAKAFRSGTTRVALKRIFEAKCGALADFQWWEVFHRDRTLLAVALSVSRLESRVNEFLPTTQRIL